MEYSINAGRQMTSARGTVALKQLLSEDFRGQDVTVKFTTARGMRQVRYVSVSDEGIIKDTYLPHLGFYEISW